MSNLLYACYRRYSDYFLQSTRPPRHLFFEKSFTSFSILFHRGREYGVRPFVHRRNATAIRLKQICHASVGRESLHGRSPTTSDSRATRTKRYGRFQKFTQTLAAFESRESTVSGRKTCNSTVIKMLGLQSRCIGGRSAN